MIEQLLLGAQVLVVVLMYLFVWRVMRTASRDLRTAPAQESTIIPAAEVAEARRAAGLEPPRIVVLQSDGSLRAGQPFTLEGPLRVGRAGDNDIVINEGIVSTHHAQLRPPDVLVDNDSTNGTMVNGTRVQGSVRLRPGDRFQIGSCTFRFEGAR